LGELSSVLFLTVRSTIRGVDGQDSEPLRGAIRSPIRDVDGQDSEQVRGRRRQDSEVGFGYMRCDQRRPQQPLRSIAGAPWELLRSLSRSSQTLRVRARAKAGAMPPQRCVVKWSVRFASFRFQEETAFTCHLGGAVQPEEGAGAGAPRTFAPLPEGRNARGAGAPWASVTRCDGRRALGLGPRVHL
jgi:hypothetical protein